MLRKGEESISHPWFSSGQPPVVLAAGRLEPAKGFVRLVEAFGCVVERRDARLVIIGEGRQRQRLEREVRERGLMDRVDLPGFQQNPYAFMSRAQSFVLSSEYEGLPNVLIQAMAFGTPVVATNCESGPAEILEGGRYGTLVPVGDVPQLAAAITESLDKPRQPEARASVLSRFGAAEATARYLALGGF
jgi:glycosyltransferase involved in cell wall biosynthesis